MVRRSRTRLYVALSVFVLLVGAGVYTFVRYKAPAEDHAVRFVPADASAYVHVFLKPSTSQRQALRSLLERFPRTDEEEEAKTFVNDLLQTALGRFDIDVDDRAGEWLGDEAAAYLSAPGENGLPTLIFAVEDEGQARAELQDQLDEQLGANLAMTYVDGFMLIGHPDSVDASVEAQESGSLSDDESFTLLQRELDPHRIASIFVRDPLASARGIGVVTRGVNLLPQEPMLGTVAVRDDAIVLDVAGGGTGNPRLPVDGYLTAGLGGAEGSFELDLPTTERAEAIVGLAESAVSVLGVDVERSAEGFSVSLPRPLSAVDVRANGTSVAVSTGVDPSEPAPMPAELRESADEALGEGFEPQVAVDLTGVPAPVREALTSRLPTPFGVVGGQTSTLHLGVRDAREYGVTRLVVSFSDA